MSRISFTFDGEDLGSDTYGLWVSNVPQNPMLADIRSTKFNLGARDGVVVGAIYQGAMYPNLEVYIEGDTKLEVMQRVDKFLKLIATTEPKLVIFDWETGIDASVNHGYYGRGYYGMVHGPMYPHFKRGGLVYSFQINLIVPSGCAVAVSETIQKATLSSLPNTFYVPEAFGDTVGGTKYSRPVFDISPIRTTVTQLTLKNVTRDEEINWRGNLESTHTLRIDCDLEFIKRSVDGGTTWTNVISGITSGDPFPFISDSIRNEFSVSGTAGVVIDITYRERFL